MKITAARTQIVRLPAEEPLAGGPSEPGATLSFVTLTISTDAGLQGIGFTFFGWALTRALRTAVDELAALTVGEDPLRIEAIVGKLRAAGAGAGPGGIFTLALAAIDMALWDIRGKAANLPVAKLIGGFRDRVPTYASGALRRTYSLDHVVRAAAKLVEKGFRQMKMQLALGGEPAREVERAQLIREAIGPDIDLMCDINQRWAVHEAIDIGHRIEHVKLFWLEDVTAHDDYQGLAEITRALQTPVAGGEYVYGPGAFRQMFEARSVDIAMADMLRAGGITQWLKIAGMAEAFNLPIVSHCFPEVTVHLVAAVPHGVTVEYMPWLSRLFEEGPLLERGELVVPTKPGLGLAFDKDAIRLYGE
jgi:L-talarate/galactarate dehydratase